MSENKPVQPQDAKPQAAHKQKPEKKNITTIIAIVLAVQVVLAVFAGIFLFKRSYEQSKTGTEAQIRQDAYNAVFDIAERANHVSNNVGIFLDGIREKAELEVLQVDSSYLYTSDGDQTIWYRIPGSGTFTVDLRMTEFIVDNGRSHVLIKAPAPAITQFNEDYSRIEKLLYKDNSFTILGIVTVNDGSVQEGEHIAQKMLTEAHVKMVKQLEMNPAYYQAAENAAERIITQLVKSMNPNVSQLTVDVVFVR